MRYILMVLIALVLTACGGSGGDSAPVDLRQACDPMSPIAGGWEDSSLNQLDIGTDCYAQTHDSCDLRFKYYKPAGNQMLIEVNATNGGESCPALGEQICGFQYNSDPTNEYLLVNCGQGNIFYFPK